MLCVPRQGGEEEERRMSVPPPSYFVGLAVTLFLGAALLFVVWWMDRRGPR
jgi:hypothetical protein